ncbi:MAG: D-alanyl-D-alanine carboxypeptidase/D-alanyl-D-alanine-endopeptidase [Gammaproteobacteria bacterium]|nr:D-alanyl-D-alanine carboxypeptidase/D-alanyl-D-alanine-endopeptidase [Gammaproteobacteria bacterium]
MTKTMLRVIFFFLLSLTAQTATSSNPALIQGKINNALKKYNPNINAGIVVRSITQDKILYQKNPHQLFLPASTLKILSSIAALSFLGVDYRFQTKILTKNIDVDHGIINNDLYIYFDGDPSLTKKDIDNIVMKLADMGLKTINGNIYIDDTVFDNSLLADGWLWGDLNYCGSAPIGAIIIDKNCFGLKLIAQKSEQPAILANNINYVSVVNSVISKNPGPDSKGCSLKLQASGNNNYHVSGCLKTHSKPQYIFTTIRNTRLYAKNLLLEQLQANDIKLTGAIELKKIPQNEPLTILVEHQSSPLSDLTKISLKQSDNTFADAIYKKLGASFFNKQSSWQSSAKAVKTILESKTRKSFNQMYMEDGSGLSRYNLITPTLLVTALDFAYRDETIKRSFINSLSFTGINGTLKNRMPNLKHRLYAKTGNMANSSSLAGYIKTKNQEIIAFAIIINSFLDSPKKYHKLQDEICNVLANS